MKRNALYIQSGGPTAVINASASGVISECRKHPKQIEKLYASEYGIVGVINGRLFDCFEEAKESAALLKQTPSMVFGSCRYQLSEENGDYDRLVETLKRFNIYYIFINGGNGSVRAAEKLSLQLKKRGYEFCLLVIPKTVDNDIYGIDHAPGFPSAARHVVVSISELVQDMYTYDTELIMFAEVMGRNTGFLAAAALAAGETGFGPDLIYVPEIEFDENKFVRDVRAVMSHNGKCFAVVAEGVRTKDGKYLFEQTTVNKADNPQLNMGGITSYLNTLLRQHFDCKIRGIDLGLMQRCAVHNVSETDVAEAELLGKEAVRGALNGRSELMIYLRRISDMPYKTESDFMTLEETASDDNTLPLTYVTKDRHFIEKEYLNYILPLIGALPAYAFLQKTLAEPEEK